MACFKKILDKYKLQLCSAKAKKSQSRRYNLYAAHKLEKAYAARAYT